MTLLEDAPMAIRPTDLGEPTGSGAVPSTLGGLSTEPSAGRPTSAWNPRRLGLLVGACVAVLIVATGLVLYAVGPLIHDRAQRSLIAAEKTSINEAAGDNEGLHRPTLPTKPPLAGSVVGIVAIPAIGLQQAVVEGVGPAQTVSGPGHVPGTAGVGQPGNASVVGRHAAYGGPFSRLGQLRVGDHIVTATTEGQSLYIVRSVRTVTLTTAPETGRLPSSADQPAGTESIGTLYGPSTHDQLTLVTSAAAAPWNSDRATVVVARMKGQPYAPTPQESRSPGQQGNTGDPEALAWLLLDLLALTAVLVGAVALYRRSTLRSAYLLTTAPLLAFTVLAAEAASRLLPAWL